MKLLPEYSTNIVVAVLRDGQVSWYVSEKEEWFLNTVSFAKAFGMTANESEKKIVESLAAGDADQFLSKLAEFSVSLSELKEWISMAEPQSNEWEDSLPCLVVDFDRKFIRNCFPEPGGMFQDHLPVGWSGEYVNEFEKIESLIPEGERFWKE